MTWARFDDGFPQHPKVVGLSDQAFRLHVTAVCYANRNLTDGVIQASGLPILLPGRPLAGVKRRAEELVAAGVWERSEDGCYVIHDFHIYNKSRGEVMAKRQQSAMAGAKGAASRWHTSLHAPVPVPDPVPVKEHHDDDRPRVFALYEGMGWTIAPAVIDRLVNMESEHPPDWLEDAFRAAAEARARNVNYVEAVLKHWRDHGRDCECRKPVSRASGQAVRPANGAADPAAVAGRLDARRRAAGM